MDWRVRKKMQIYSRAPMILYFPANLIIAIHKTFLFSISVASTNNSITRNIWVNKNIWVIKIFQLLTTISGQQRPTATNDDEQKHSPTQMQVDETRERVFNVESQTASIRPQLRRTNFGRIESSHRPEPRSKRTIGLLPDERKHHGDLFSPLHEFIHHRRSRKKSVHLHLGSWSLLTKLCQQHYNNNIASTRTLYQQHCINNITTTTLYQQHFNNGDDDNTLAIRSEEMQNVFTSSNLKDCFVNLRLRQQFYIQFYITSIIFY